MTKEELAEEYVNSKADKGNFDLEQFGKAYFSESSMKQAFLAGLKAKTQWHDLRKDPDDLPEENTLVFSDKGMIVMWRNFSWAEYSPNYDNIKLRKWEEPVAWCELPTFKE